MPIYICEMVEDAAQVVNSGEARAIIAELDLGAAFSAAGWLVAAGAAYFFRSAPNQYPTTIDGIDFAWSCGYDDTPGAKNP